MLIRCSCDTGDASKFQDKIYGSGIRVATPVLGKSGEAKGRCTCCSKEAPEKK